MEKKQKQQSDEKQQVSQYEQEIKNLFQIIKGNALSVFDDYKILENMKMGIRYIEEVIQKGDKVSEEMLYRFISDKSVNEDIRMLVGTMLYLVSYRPIIAIQNEPYYCCPFSIPIIITMDNKSFEQFNFKVEELLNIPAKKIINIKNVDNVFIDTTLYTINNFNWLVGSYVRNYIENIITNKPVNNNISKNSYNHDITINTNMVVITLAMNCVMTTKKMSTIVSMDRFVVDEEYKEKQKQLLFKEIEKTIKSHIHKYNNKGFCDVQVFHPVEFFEIPSVNFSLYRMSLIDMQLFFAKHKIMQLGKNRVEMTYHVFDINLSTSAVRVLIVDKYTNNIIFEIHFIVNSEIDDENFIVRTIEYIQNSLGIDLFIDDDYETVN